MNDAANPNIFDQIQSICQDYRRQLKEGRHPSIEATLEKFEAEARAQLFQNLLNLEIQFFSKQGTPTTSDEYHRRFPQYARLIRQAFFESTIMSQENKETPAAGQATIIGVPQNRQLGEYELVRELGRGGFGVVYEAKHLRRRDTVALKTLPTNFESHANPHHDAERLHKFRREFRSLAEINHPNLIGMQTLEVAGEQWFFTMDLVDGVDFLEYVRPQGECDDVRLRKAFSQLVRGISALHDRGIIHRDLKPSNVLVSSMGRVTILDFGLVAELQQSANQTVSMKSRQFAGTPRYSAPEQMTGTRLPASDWYALGVLLFEALTGKTPFEGSSVEVMFKKQSEPAPHLTGTPEIAADLAELVNQLLERDPDQRPSSLRIRDVLGVESEVTQEDSTDSSLCPVFMPSDQLLIGRERQLAQLEKAFTELTSSRKPVMTMISGRSGEGKSSLVEKFLAPLRLDENVVVLTGRCYDRESVPFKAVDTLIDALVAFLRSRSSQEIQHWLPDDIPMLAQLFPVLRRVETIANRSSQEISVIDSRQIRYRAFNALRELFITISCTTPIVLFIDDLQWGDADSAAALFEILSPPDSPTVMLIGSYRSDEAEESPFLTEWSQGNSSEKSLIIETLIEVAPLTEEESVQLIAHRLGGSSKLIREQAKTLYDETHGNPYFLDQSLEGYDEETGEFQVVPLDQIISQRLQRLPPDAAHLLKVIAIAGQAAPVEEIAKVTQSADQAFSTLTHMRSERLIRLIGTSGLQQVDTYHDKIRETVLERIPDKHQRMLHLKFAEMIEDNEGLVAESLLQSLSSSSTPGEYKDEISPRVFDLAHHFVQANDPRAFVYQLLAAEQSLQAYAIDDALDLFQYAEHLLPNDAPPNLQFRVKFAMGRVYLWNKNIDSAIDCYQNAVNVAETKFDRARAHAGLGYVNAQVAKLNQAIQHFDDALRQLDIHLPKTFVSKVFSFAVTGFRVFAMPAAWHKLQSTKQAQSAMLTHEIMAILGHLVFLDKDLLSCINAQIKSAQAIIQVGGSRHLAVGYTSAATVISGIGFQWLGSVFHNRSARLEAELEDPALLGYFVAGQGHSAYYGGNLRQAELHLMEAVKHLRRSHSLAELQLCIHQLRHAQAYIESAGIEYQTAKVELKLATENSNTQGICWGSYNVACAAARAGRLSEAIEHMKKANGILTGEHYVLTEAIRAVSDGFVQIQCSDFKAARRLATKSWELTSKSLFFIDQPLLCLPILIESIAGPDWREPLGQSDCREIKRMLRWSALLYPTIPNHRPHLQRVKGRAAFAMGMKNKAIRHFKKAICLSDDKGMAYQKAKSLLDLAAAEKEGREEHRREAIELLQKMESVIPHAESWLLGDQYDESVLAPNVESLN